MKRTSAFLAAVILAGIGTAHATRYHQYTEKFGDPAHGAEVVAATFFGGGGNEWLSGGGFAPDGSIILVGNIIGPGLTDAGKEPVIGTDTPPPPPAERIPDLDSKGKPRMNKDGTPRWLAPSWRHEHVTGFVLRTSADLSEANSLHRLPWSAGAITDAVVGPDGAIYIAGRATEAITKLGGDVRELPVADNGMSTGGCDHTFLAQLSPDASKAVWVRHMNGWSNAPKLALTRDGNLRLTAQDLRVFSPDGTLVKTTTIQGGLGHLVAVNPKDGTYVRGGEHHSPTGRDPWRCATLDVYNPDGSRKYQLYDWLGPYVGLDNLRLVSDTAVRRVTFDPDGYLLLCLWSDGGNSVALREPFDIRSFSPEINGLGFSAWGAGVLSCAYIVKIDTTTYHAVGGTMWLAYLESKEKPNSAWVDHLGHAPDGSVCFSGRAASSIIQTKNRLSPSQSDQHVVVLEPDLGAIRFSSTIPGGGATQVGDDREHWAIVSGKVGGKQRVLFVCGSAGSARDLPTPVRNGYQAGFGGGWSDGYALLLEMDRLPAPEESPATPSGRNWTPTGNAAEVPSFIDKKGNGPVAGQSFTFSDRKWVTVDAEFRAENEELWPSFLYGRPREGRIVFDPKQPTASFALVCDRICQPHGAQSRRVLGELVGEDPKAPIAFSLEVRSLGPFQAREESGLDRGKPRKRTFVWCDADTILHIDGRSVPIKAECALEFKKPNSGTTPERVQLDLRFTATGAQLGLGNPATSGTIQARVSAVAYAGD